MKLVSIIVPVYNLEDFLEECIQSVLGQSYSRFELILVNDGSTDSSGVICDKFAEKDPRIRVLHQKNGGVSSARNSGIIASQGDFVTFLDGDDILDNDFLDHLVNLINLHPGSMVSACSMSKFIDFSNLHFQSIGAGESLLFEDEALIELLYQRLINAPFAKLFKAELFSDVKFPTGIKIGEDLLVNVEVFSQRPTVVVSQKRLYGYRIREGSSIRKSTFEDRWIALNAILRAKEKYVHTQNLEKAFNSRIFWEAIFATFYLETSNRHSGMYLIEKDEVESLIKQIRKGVLLNSRASILTRLLAFMACISVFLPQKFLKFYGSLGQYLRKNFKAVNRLRERSIKS